MQLRRSALTAAMSEASEASEVRERDAVASSKLVTARWLARHHGIQLLRNGFRKLVGHADAERHAAGAGLLEQVDDLLRSRS